MQLPHLILALSFALTSGLARAHDTWFQGPLAGATALELKLGTGTRYPLYETGVGAEYLERQGCHGQRAGDPERAMTPLRNEAQALVLRVPPQATACWAQLVPLEIELAPDLVALYLREIQAPLPVRRQWAQLQARGLPWKERYTKHARIDGLTPASAAPAAAAPMAMDIVRQPAPDGGWHFLVLREGSPLAGLAMELISEKATHGLWRLTDGQGRVAWPALPAGKWLLRGTQLRLSEEDPTRWDSGFVTLAFEVPLAPAARVSAEAR